MKVYIYQCEKCGKAVVSTHELNVEGYKLLEAGVTDAAQEKHVPVIEKRCGEIRVSVGSVMHPATAEHYIEWVLLVTDNGYQLKYIPVGEEAVVSFRLGKGEKLQEVYAYCNLHGLWKAE
ncbi:MAG: desulfoferrodoxin [Clostridia bacterium]|nr:desulfoferrodoxin [Clostridia bacterium]